MEAHMWTPNIHTRPAHQAGCPLVPCDPRLPPEATASLCCNQDCWAAQQAAMHYEAMEARMPQKQSRPADLLRQLGCVACHIAQGEACGLLHSRVKLLQAGHQTAEGACRAQGQLCLGSNPSARLNTIYQAFAVSVQARLACLTEQCKFCLRQPCVHPRQCSGAANARTLR